MFTASTHQLSILARALGQCAGGIHFLESVYPVLSFEGSDLAVWIDTPCPPPMSWNLSPQQLLEARAVVTSGIEQVYLSESAPGVLRFETEARPMPELTPETAGNSRKQWDHALAALVVKARAYHPLVLAQGVCSLQFTTAPGQWSIVECLTDSTWISTYQDGALKSRAEYPPLSAYALLKALAADHLYLE